MDMSETGLERGSDALVSANAAAQLDAGVTVVRDTGSVPGAELPTSVGGLRIIRSGGMLAPAGRYHDSLTTPAEADEVVGIVARAVADGAQWVKIIADFPGPDWNWFAAPPTYPIEVVREIVAVAHDAGARVAAHVSSAYVAELVRAGIDSIEHGPLVTVDLVDEMAERGTAWTPTVSTVFAKHLDPLAQGDSPIAGFLRGVYEDMERSLARAVELGVPIMAGTDERDHGSIWFELEQLKRFGLSGADALAAASIWPRRYLGLTLPEEGAPADLVLFDGDPREADGPMPRPVAVVADGELVREPAHAAVR
jgi:imidazolonepropionase-like amidohydrolase